MHSFDLFIFAAFVITTLVKVPCVPLYNAADPTLCVPVIGLGTGGYNAARSSETKPALEYV